MFVAISLMGYLLCYVLHIVTDNTPNVPHHRDMTHEHSLVADVTLGGIVSLICFKVHECSRFRLDNAGWKTCVANIRQIV